MQNFNEDEKNRIIEMAWQDRTPLGRFRGPW